MIRKASISDANEIAYILVHSWQINFKGIIPDHYLNKMDVEKITEGIKKTIEVSTLFVYVVENKVVGFVGCGHNRIQKFSSFDRELHAIHVLPEYKGNGIGKALFVEVRDLILNQGYTNMVLSVFEDNPATFFYEKLGGKLLGTRTVEYGGTQCVERVYGWNFI